MSRRDDCKNGKPRLRLWEYPRDQPRKSVDRLGVVTPGRSLDIAEAAHRNRENNFYGWAVLTVGQVRSQDCEAKHVPIDDRGEDNNEEHCDIVIPDNIQNNHDALQALFQELSLAAACWDRDQLASKLQASSL